MNDKQGSANIGFTTLDDADEAAFKYDRALFNGQEISVKVIKG